jgi:hypothetical protein
MKSHVVSIGTALAVIAGSGVTSAQPPPTASVDSLVSAAKNAAGLDWSGTFLRLCVVPPPAAPGGGRGAAAAPAGPPAKDTWYAEPAKVADNLYFPAPGSTAPGPSLAATESSSSRHSLTTPRRTRSPGG